MSEMTKMTKPVADLFDEGSVTLDGLKKEFGIGRTTAYELMNAGRLPWTKVYGRRLVPRAAVKRLLAEGLLGGAK
jgi:excisionase family DNA binding protein